MHLKSFCSEQKEGQRSSVIITVKLGRWLRLREVGRDCDAPQRVRDR